MSVARPSLDIEPRVKTNRQPAQNLIDPVGTPLGEMRNDVLEHVGGDGRRFDERPSRGERRVRAFSIDQQH